MQIVQYRIYTTIRVGHKYAQVTVSYQKVSYLLVQVAVKVVLVLKSYADVLELEGTLWYAWHQVLSLVQHGVYRVVIPLVA